MPDLLKQLRQLNTDQLTNFAESLRERIIATVSSNGGHLASSCGCVELIVALHRVFRTPQEKIFFDVGHQAYAHKLLTGRADTFDTLRKFGGLSGFPSPAESLFDPAVSGHAGCALSAALGHCAAKPDSDDKVIAVIGDGAMGCGVTFEALNHAESLPGKQRLIVILNDNRMSISGNVGALSKALNRVIAAHSYNKFRRFFKNMLKPVPKLKNFFSRLNEAGKSVFLPPALLFETLGFRYFGAVNGNDLQQLIPTLERIKDIEGPVILHVITEKGHGCKFAAAEPTRYHGIAGCDPDTGELKGSGDGFSQAFAQALIQLATENPDICAVCPAMLEGTGVSSFAEKFPDRCFDTGITEAHAMTFASGLAAAGKRPVCAFYDTFLQRALDEVYHDIALAKLPVIIAVDRAGAVADGPTHHGIYNCSFLRAIPQVTLLSLSAAAEIYEALKFAVSLNSPVIIRYPKGSGIPVDRIEPFVCGKAVIRRAGSGDAPVIWATAGEVKTALDVAGIVEKSGIDCTVIDARFLKPFDRETAEKMSDRMQFAIEDHSLTGGLYSALCEALSHIPHRKIYGFGWSNDEIIPHGNVKTLKEHYRLNSSSIAEKIQSLMQKS